MAAMPQMEALSEEEREIDAIVARARAAQARFEEGADQARYDRAALAAAWAVMEPARNRELAELAVRTTGLGNVADKITKNHRKTLGLLRDIKEARTCGVIAEDAANGLTEIARPIGVIGAIVPSTNPVATPLNNIVNALKCGNAIVLSPSPKGVEACARLLEHVYAEFDKAGIDRDLVQMAPAPSSKAKTQRIMEVTDLLVVTGSQDNVRRAYSSGTPAIGVGAGNVTVIVDESADPADAAAKIARSKMFDNATSCSSENAVIVVDAVYDAFVAALQAEDGAVLAQGSDRTVAERLWPDGHLNRAVLAQDAPKMLAALDLTDSVPTGTRFVAVPTDGVGPAYPLSGEKLSLVMALYRVSDFDAAVEKARSILTFQGAGHSIGLHSGIDRRALDLAHTLPTCRVIVNQAHCFATGGSFDNGMPFSLSMGCGSWGGNSIDDNLNWRHFMNTTKVVRTIPPREPALDDIFGHYWDEVGR